MSNEYYLDSRVAAEYDENTGSRGNDAVVRDDIPFYVELAREAAAKDQTVLELGCGTGRVTLPIAGAGVEIVGLDSSPAMLDVARGKPGGHDLHWVEGDMADFKLDRRFGLVIVPFRSFLLLLTTAEQKSCLRCIHDHLVEGGRLALNMFNPDLITIASWNGARRGLWEREPLPGGRVRWSSRRYRAASQQLEADEVTDELSDAGAIISRLSKTLRLRYVFRYEMEHLLALSGFEVEALFGWFDRRPFEDDSSEMVWVAKKTT
jgi:SAM-dependent methyltransferase